MKKIVFIIPLQSSFELFLKELGAFLVSEGWSLYIFCNTDSHAPIMNGMHFIHTEIPRGIEPLKMIKTARVLNQKIQEIKPDIVHAHFQAAILTYRLSGLADRYCSIATIHGAIFNIQKGWVRTFAYKQIEKFGFSKFERVWVLNAQDLEDVSLIHPNVALCQSKGVGCDIDRFDPRKFDESAKHELRESLGINQNDFVLVFIGRLVHFKGFPIVIKAFKELEKQYDKVKLVVVGAQDAIHPTGLTNAENEYFQRSNNIKKMGFRQDVEIFLAIADLTFFPSQKEGLPVCIMESMAMEVPVITLNSRGCRDLIVHNKSGFVIQNTETKSYVSAIDKLIKNRERLTKMKEILKTQRASVSRMEFVKHEYEYYESLLV